MRSCKDRPTDRRVSVGRTFSWSKCAHAAGDLCDLGVLSVPRERAREKPIVQLRFQLRRHRRLRACTFAKGYAAQTVCTSQHEHEVAMPAGTLRGLCGEHQLHLAERQTCVLFGSGDTHTFQSRKNVGYVDHGLSAAFLVKGLVPAVGKTPRMGMRL